MLTEFLDEFGPWNDLEEFIPSPDPLEVPRLFLRGKQDAISLGFWKLEPLPHSIGSIKDSLAIMLKHSTPKEPPDRFFSDLEIDLEKDGTMNFSTDEENSLFSNKRDSHQFDFFDITDVDNYPEKNIPFEDTGDPTRTLAKDLMNLNYDAMDPDASRPFSTSTFSEFNFLASDIDIDSFQRDNPLKVISPGNILTSKLSPVQFSSKDDYHATSLDSLHNHSDPDESFSLADSRDIDTSFDAPNYTYALADFVRKALTKRQCPTPPQDSSKAMRQGRISKRPRKKTKVKRDFDYSYAQIHCQIELAPQLQNTARLPDPGDTGHESQLVLLQDQQGCIINRTRYVRGRLDGLKHLHKNVIYERNEFFDVSHPYQQEFTRVETDLATGLPINETRSGLCPYCAELSFYELKNSSYAQHLSHSHGIFTDNFLTPNPLNIGHYAVAKSTNSPRKTTARVRSHEGVVCPACYKVVEIRCWTSTLEKKPLSNYLRHFKEEHRVGKNRSSYFREQA